MQNQRGSLGEKLKLWRWGENRAEMELGKERNAVMVEVRIRIHHRSRLLQPRYEPHFSARGLVEPPNKGQNARSKNKLPARWLASRRPFPQNWDAVAALLGKKSTLFVSYYLLVHFLGQSQTLRPVFKPCSLWEEPQNLTFSTLGAQKLTLKPSDVPGCFSSSG